jgi:hypothetical protein
VRDSRLPQPLQEQELRRGAGERGLHDVVEQCLKPSAARAAGIPIGDGRDLVEGAQLLPLGPSEDTLEVVRAEAGGEVQDCPRSSGEGQPVPALDFVVGEPSDAVEPDSGPRAAQGSRA